ncbi:MAG: hypothetical protein V1495_04885 [Pseudomonadota bacterium]
MPFIVVPVAWADPAGHLLTVRTISFSKSLYSSAGFTSLVNYFTFGKVKPSSFDLNLYVAPSNLSETSAQLIRQTHQLIMIQEEVTPHVQYSLNGPPVFLDAKSTINGRYNVCFEFHDSHDLLLGVSCHNIEPRNDATDQAITLALNQSPIGFLNYSIKAAYPSPATGSEITAEDGKHLLVQFRSIKLDSKPVPSGPFRLMVGDQSPTAFLGNWNPINEPNILNEIAGDQYLVVPRTSDLIFSGQRGLYDGDGASSFHEFGSFRCDLSGNPNSNVVTCSSEDPKGTTLFAIYKL